ncbi:MAG TPA: amino acid--tRNA ligase-related protein [Polyangiaceae bacterium]|nr:amino acid--tRNA ligase-related protein [Polyangiaceae bacterium]
MDGRANRSVRSARVPGRLTSPLFPSDLAGEPALPGPLLIAGRVLSRSADTATLADAFAWLTAQGEVLSALEVGDLVVLNGTWDGRVFAAGSLAQRQPAPEPRGDGDLARSLFRGVGARLRARSRALAEVRAYFSEEGFVEVETPYRVPAPGVDAHVEALAADRGYLITSPELEMKRLVVAGVPRQFQLARVSRRDESGPLHEPEFTLLEWYRAFAGQAEILRDTEAIVSRVARVLRGVPVLVTPSGRPIAVEPPFERVSVAEAFAAHAGVSDVSDLAASDEQLYFRLLVERVEPALALCDRALFLTDYPISQAALARASLTDPRFAERFELYVGGVELSNGYGELTDPIEQRRRMLLEQGRREADGRSVYPLNERFLEALAAGMPPTGGNALGFDRLLMLALSADSIGDVMAFPRAEL